jgi:hypothetical protein
MISIARLLYTLVQEIRQCIVFAFVNSNRGIKMTFDFYLKCFFALGIGSMVILRDFLAATKGTGIPPPALNVADTIDPFAPLEEQFFDEQGPWRDSQRSDELIQIHAELEKENLILENHSTFMQ